MTKNIRLLCSALIGLMAIYVRGLGQTALENSISPSQDASLNQRDPAVSDIDLFYRPFGVAVGNDGNLYVADEGNEMIWKITPSGGLVALAGFRGASGSADGTGIGALFSDPSGVAVDKFGNVYVADSGNSTIRRVNRAGEVTTLAGLAKSDGSADGVGSAARFSYPQGVAVDGAGNIYVAEQLNHTIRKVTADGRVTTLAGLPENAGSADGTGSTARFRRPIGLALDSASNIYVADSGNHTIRKVTPVGLVATLAGMPGHPGNVDGSGMAARFDCPVGLALDIVGNMYVGDAGNHTIRKVTPLGRVTTLAGFVGTNSSTGAVAGSTGLGAPSGTAVDSAGNVFLADAWLHAVFKVTPTGIVSKLTGMVSCSEISSGPAHVSWIQVSRDTSGPAAQTP